MARIRTIKPEFFKSEEIAELEPLDRLLFIGLWTMADGEGKLLDRPKRIKAELFPYDANDVESGLKKIEKAGLIIRYLTCSGINLVKIVNFSKHQRITGREFEVGSEYPDPTPDIINRFNEKQAGRAFINGETPGKQSGNNGETSNVQERKGKEGKGKEGKGTRENAPELFKIEIPFSVSKWLQWKNFLKTEKRKNYKTAETESAAIAGLMRKAGDNPKTAEMIIDQSIENNWTGLFELKNQSKNEINQRNFGTTRPNPTIKHESEFGTL